MKKSGIIILLVVIVIAVLCGITAADLWGYFIDLTKLFISMIVSWVKAMTETLRDGFAPMSLN